MPSLSLQRLVEAPTALLDDIERAHRFVRGSGLGARAATEQINQAYVVLLSAQFQAFCRNLHSECAEYYVKSIPDPDLRNILLLNMVYGRKIDHGNPNAGNIGSDFGRMVPSFWIIVDAQRPRNPLRRIALEELNKWRNAIAHQDFDATMIKSGRLRLTLMRIQNWRKACDGLARSFEHIMKDDLQRRTGIAPW